MPDASLDRKPRYRRYAIGARKLPDLRRLRAAFARRATHSTLEAWALLGTPCYSGLVSDCAYCCASAEDAWLINELAVAIPPHSPAASCHVVVAPRRHVAAFYDLDVQEQHVIWDMLRDLRQRIGESLLVQGFDAGFVDVPPGNEHAHTHVHLVPRVAGESVVLPAGAEWVDLT